MFNQASFNILTFFFSQLIWCYPFFFETEFEFPLSEEVDSYFAHFGGNLFD